MVIIAVVNAHDPVYDYLDRRLLYDSPIKILNHRPVVIRRVQRDREGQTGYSRDYDIICAKGRKAYEKLLNLVTTDWRILLIPRRSGSLQYGSCLHP